MQPKHANDIAAHAAAAMTSLRELGLPPTPQNYAVWFEFHAGEKPALRRALSVALSNRRVIDSYMMAELHDLFLADHSGRRATQEARATLRDAAGRIREAGADVARYGETLNDAAGRMQSDGGSLAGLISLLARETESLSARSARLGEDLDGSSRRIAELESQLAAAHKASMTDALTSLPNRRAFDAMVLEHAGRTMNSGEALSLLMIDIDHFKRINDAWGHTVGDAVIRHVALTIAELSPEAGRAARYGGEEFAVLLPGAALKDATEQGERLRQALAMRRLSLRANAEPIGNVTISIGAARYEPGEPVTGWIERTDAALYRAKRQGRNRVVAAEPAMDPAG